MQRAVLRVHKEERHTGSWGAVECCALYLHVLLSQFCASAQHLLNGLEDHLTGITS